MIVALDLDFGMDLDVVLRILAALQQRGVDYVVFGGIALNLHGLARTTEDLDLFIRPTSENVERLKEALRSVFDDPHLDEITAEDLLGDYPAIQYVPPIAGFHVDLVARLGEAFAFDDLEWETKDVEGTPVRVVTPMTLYRMKRDTVRLKDKGDAERLRARFGLKED